MLGALADVVFADPARWHPVAGFGACAAAWERRWYADRRSAGIAYAAVLVAGVVAVGAAAEAATRRRPVQHAVATAVTTWAVLGGTSLSAHGKALAAHLDGASTPNLDAAREIIPALCGRDPQSLDAAGMARAGTESMAENTSDAAVAPLLWGAVAGIPGLLEEGSCGVLVEPRVPAGLAEALRSLLERPAERETLALRARRSAEARFDIWRNGRSLAEALGFGASDLATVKRRPAGERTRP